MRWSRVPSRRRASKLGREKQDGQAQQISIREENVRSGSAGIVAGKGMQSQRIAGAERDWGRNRSYYFWTGTYARG